MAILRINLTPGGDTFDDTNSNTSIIAGNDGDDTIDGGGGSDFILGNDGDDLIDGGTGRDILFGGRGDDTIFGGAGRDVLNGDFGADTLRGGSGFDDYIFSSRTAGFDENGAAASDTIVGFDEARDTIFFEKYDAADELVYVQDGADVEIYVDIDGDNPVTGDYLAATVLNSNVAAVAGVTTINEEAFSDFPFTF